MLDMLVEVRQKGVEEWEEVFVVGGQVLKFGKVLLNLRPLVPT